MTRWHWWSGLLVLGLVGCAETEAPVAVQAAQDPRAAVQSPLSEAPSAAGVDEGAQTCEVSDEAFVKRSLRHLWGRNARTITEVALLAEIAERDGRGALLDAMMRSPEFLTRWSGWLRDTFYVNRAGERANPECQGEPLLTAHDGSLARWVREHGPAESAGYPSEWNLSDLVRSTLVEDDLSPLLRALPFLHIGSWVIRADSPDESLGTRRLYTSIFQRAYLNRRMECLHCHNSSFSVTGSTDPALDRSWEIPGRYEAAIYGDDTGRSDDDIAALFRIRGVMALYLDENTEEKWLRDEGHRPWGADPGCGQFLLPEDIEDDWLGFEGYLVDSHGKRSSVYDLEALLRASFEQVRSGGVRVGEDLAVDGKDALVQLIAMSFAEQVWEELTGYALTVPHGLPRNRAQRDILAWLADVFIDSGYSLRATLRAAMLHPFAAQASPERCGADYYLPPIFDPWIIAAEDPVMRNNGPGDMVNRVPARILLGAVSAAMQWPAPGESFFPDDSSEGLQFPPEASFQRDIGAFLTDGETGFRGSSLQEALAWESAFGRCRTPEWAEAQDDYIDRLIAAGAGATLEDAIVTLKDRLLTDPDLSDPEERQLLAALTGSPLDTPLAEMNADEALRRCCIAFLSTPWFLLNGVDTPDRIGTTVPIVVPGSDKASLCDELAAALGGQCQQGSLSL